MAEKDALKEAKFGDGGSDLFVTIKDGSPQKLRVLTLDPVVHVDKFANTRYAFVVYNYTEGKAQILDKGASIAKQLAALHNDEDYGDLNKVDIKITATGEGMETRYSVNVLPKTEELTVAQIKEAANLKLDDIIKNGVRMSKVNEGEEVPSPDDRQIEEDEVHEVNENEPVNLDDIPF